MAPFQAIGAHRRGHGPITPNQDAAEAAIAEALTRASEAGQWEVVATLARELQARREARAGVVDLEMARKRRGTP
jgi:hypothetical protein